MTSRHERAKRATRTRISDVATRMFLDLGFDAVTVSDVARAAGVSKVTVFAHFPRKEDLLIDRAPEATELVLRSLQQRTPDSDPIQALQQLAHDLASERHPISGLHPTSRPLLEIIAESPALISRAREIAFELEAVIANELRLGLRPAKHPDMLAALVVAAYRTVLTNTVRRVLAGDQDSDLLTYHHEQLATAFDSVRAAATAIEP